MRETRVILLGSLLGLVFVLGGAATGWADIYKYVDRNGVVHFTNTPTNGNFQLYLKEGRNRSGVGDIIRRYASAFNLDAALVRAVIKVESDFNPRAVSPKGALGIMQLLPETAHDMNVSDPMNIEENIRGGSRYLRQMLDRFRGDLDLALAAYNAGPGAVTEHDGIPPFAETRDYVQKVKKFLELYRRGEEQYL
jgi:soluble lytic murein transglycosylase-like protein